MSINGPRRLLPWLRAARPGLLREALHSLLLAAVALFFLNFNLMGTAIPSKHYSQDLVYAWFGDQSWLYPPPPPASVPSTPMRPHVAVVMLDEHALALRGGHWPVSLQFHAQFLAELEVLRPRAVFLDFLLLDPGTRADMCELLGVGARLRAEGIALYLGVTAPQDLEPFEAAGCRDAQGRLLHAAEVFTPVAVRRQADDSDFVNRRYPFEDRPVGSPPGSGLPSAAVRMYCDFTLAAAACLKRLLAHRPEDAGFELAWSPQGDEFNRRWSKDPCALGLSPLRVVLNKAALPRESPCPPVATLFASALLSPVEDPALGANEQTLFTLAEHSFVLVGGDFRGSGDLFTTPLHTLLPGVYYHAVALQNLLAFKGYPKVRKEFRSPRLLYYLYDLVVLWLLAAIFLWRQRLLQRVQPLEHSPFQLSLSPAARDWLAPFVARFPTPAWILAATVLLLLMAAYHTLQLIAVAVITVAVIVVEMRVAHSSEIRDRMHAQLLYAGTMGISLLVIGAAIGIGYGLLRLPPGDWLGYLSFVAFGFFIAHAAILEFGRRVDELHLARLSGGATK
jgi:CHASE2 domain